jgi:hypothetical protein
MLRADVEHHVGGGQVAAVGGDVIGAGAQPDGQLP